MFIFVKGGGGGGGGARLFSQRQKNWTLAHSLSGERIIIYVDE